MEKIKTIKQNSTTCNITQETIPCRPVTWILNKKNPPNKQKTETKTYKKQTKQEEKPTTTGNITLHTIPC